MMKKVKKQNDAGKTELQKVEERREEVLARGRKFKYPIQYAKHKLVFNTIIISAVAVILMVVLGWFSLYKAQTDSDVLYRITQILPVPVAEVDGENVRFSDYLMLYKSSLMAVEQQAGQIGGDADAEGLKDTYKRAAIVSAEKYSYAVKLGEENEIEVSQEEIDEMFVKHRKVGGTERSEESFLKVLNDNFGWSKSDYERMLYLSIMKMKVSEYVDKKASETAKKVEEMIKEGKSYSEIAQALGEDVIYEETGSLVDDTNLDGGRTAVAVTLEPGGQSGKFLSNNGDGYYFVQLIDKNETQVNYASIKIVFSEFDKKFEQIKTDGKIKEHIAIPE